MSYLPRTLVALGFAAVLLSCEGRPSLPVGVPSPSTYFTATRVSSRFNVAEHMRASIEMQISGEPFAQLLGRSLVGYDRFSRVPDLYTDPSTGIASNDPLSYSMAIESYEYSKQPMNQLSFESGAGLALQYGPLLNPANVSGDAAYLLLRDRLIHFAELSASAGHAGTAFVVVPIPIDNPLNVYGWPGYWPVMAEFRSFIPDIDPIGGMTRGCTLTSGYGAASAGVQVVGTYECGYLSLNLSSRDAKVEKIIEPAALGFAAWKQGLWTINYWQSLHDTLLNAITAVDDADLSSVGAKGNTVVGRYVDPTDPAGKRLLDGNPGVYLGDIPLEGWQGLTMLEELDNKAALLLRRFMTVDGLQLAGFASTKAAIEYDYAAPLRWWPHAIAATEDSSSAPASGVAWKIFPQPTQLSVADGASSVRDLTALAGGYAQLFALTDEKNPAVGGTVAPRATFDGDPFPKDDQLPDGEETPHDRALAIMKVAVVTLDRMHFHPVAHVLVDDARVTNGKVQRGAKVTTLDAAYAIVGLRAALRSMQSALTLYSNDTPDTHGLSTAIDGAPTRGAPSPIPERIVELIRAQADFIADKLTARSGAVANSYDLERGLPDTSPTRLEAQAAAVRGLLDAYLATGNERYRQVATRVFEDLDRRFWMGDVRCYRTLVGEDKTLHFTPAAFGTIQGALRQYWKLVARRPGNERVARELLEKVKRLNKLVANGWDDANGDDVIQYPEECTGAGLQMGERALTGEIGFASDGDQDRDCVKEISFVHEPASLAAELVLIRR